MLLETPIAGDPRTLGSGEAVCSALSRSAPLHARYAAAGASGERTLKPGCGWERCLLASVLRLFILLCLPCSISHYRQNVVSKTGQPSWTLTFCDFRSLHPLVNIIFKMFFKKLPPCHVSPQVFIQSRELLGTKSDSVFSWVGGGPGEERFTGAAANATAKEEKSRIFLYL